MRANDFTGQIPTQLGHLPKLGKCLRCGHSTLKPLILSSDITYLPQIFLGSLQLHANELTGEMPQEVCLLRSDKLQMLVADCDPDNELDEVTCEQPSCCTRCY